MEHRTQSKSVEFVGELREYFILSRIQSLPLTLVTLLLAYLTVAPTIFTREAAELVLIGSLGHVGFYLMNEIADAEHDYNQGKEDKPLVSGTVRVEVAILLMLVLTISSFTLAALLFPTEAFVFYIVAMASGAIYNIFSKTKPFALLWLGVWGVAIVGTGAAAANSVNLITMVLAALMAVHMILMTIIGDLKDLEGDESSILSHMNTHIYEDDGEKKIFLSYIFMGSVYNPLSLTQSVLIFFVPVSAYVNNNSIISLVVVVASVGIAEMVIRLLESIMVTKTFDPDRIKRKITKYEAAFLISILILSLSYVSVEEVVLILASSVGWGLGWQKVLYGDALFFSS